MKLLLKLVRAQITKSRVTTATVVKALNVQKNVDLSFNSGTIMAMVSAYGFERTKETFHRGVVQTVTHPAHARSAAVAAQDRLI